MASKIARHGRRSYAFSGAEIDRIVERMELVGDPLRLIILSSLLEGESDVTSLCGPTALSQAGVRHHLTRLRAGGLVQSVRRGKHVVYSLSAAGRAILGACERLL